MEIKVYTSSFDEVIISSDDEDLKNYTLHSHVRKTGHNEKIYVILKYKGKLVYLHRIIAQRMFGRLLRTDEHVDHIDGSGLNNSRFNLRVCEQRENNYNIRKQSNCHSIYLGVTYDISRNQWIAKMRNNYKEVFIGRFDSEEDAALAYDKVARELHGEFANLNFPEISDYSDLIFKVSKRSKSSIYHGISYRKDRDMWQAFCYEKDVFGINRKISLGCFKDEIEAAVAYDRYVIENSLDKPLNFPQEAPVGSLL